MSYHMSPFLLKGLCEAHFSFLLFLCVNVYFERERVCEQGRGRERGGERIPNRPHVVSAECNVGLEPMNREAMT